MVNHTRGKLLHYTAPLRPEFPTIIHEILTLNGIVVVKWGGFDGLDMSKTRIAANARRLVACWNACDGITTEELERKARVPSTATRIK